MRLCEEHRLGGIKSASPDDCIGCALDEALKALSRHNGRDWCAVCGFGNDLCTAKTTQCLGAIARRLHPRTR